MSGALSVTTGLRVGELLNANKGRTIPIVFTEATLDEVVKVMASAPHSRVVFVIDEEERLVGTIPLGALVPHIFGGNLSRIVNRRLMLSLVTTRIASDIMVKKPLFVRKEESVYSLLHSMVVRNIKEVAVVDEDHKVVAELTMVDLLVGEIEGRLAAK
jgi:CBS domain-containing protein